YGVLETAYMEKNVHPADLKAAVAREVDAIISPIRKHFEGKATLLDVYRDES
ncbi:MAG: tyrosine--tRNA ligase, partial [Thaumarchaeota archaeon]|nr:tyrosine--tRNA ligase [Nitrososphaerota archaeon]